LKFQVGEQDFLCRPIVTEPRTVATGPCVVEQPAETEGRSLPLAVL